MPIVIAGWIPILLGLYFPYKHYGICTFVPVIVLGIAFFAMRMWPLRFDSERVRIVGIPIRWERFQSVTAWSGEVPSRFIRGMKEEATSIRFRWSRFFWLTFYAKPGDLSAARGFVDAFYAACPEGSRDDSP